MGMQNSLHHFTELFELNINNHQLSRQLVILYTPEYEQIALAIYDCIKSSFTVSLRKLTSIFDSNLEKYILEKDIFLLLYTMPWANLKTYYSQVRPVLTRQLERSFVIRDCIHDFEKIYAVSFTEIKSRHDALIELGNQTKKVLIKNELGTHLEFSFPTHSPWRSIDGTNIANEIVPSEVSNHTPIVNGVVVFTGTLVSLIPIGKKYGRIQIPIILKIENGLIVATQCDNKDLENDLINIFDYCQGNHEVVELGIGTNSAIELLGISAPFEERKAGFHLGTGGYQPKSQHIDFIFDSSEIYFDDYCVFSSKQFHL